ncbi:MAG: hypothetical protein ABIO99_06665 [Candidatus Limnocylindria bacterium]
MRHVLDARAHAPDDARGRMAMNSVVLARTASGSTYVLTIADDGVQWRRLARHGHADRASFSGWESSVPRIVPGERLLIGNLRTTPVLSVSIVPA